ncbi:acid phosphatase [Phenylobacterium deserti]|uniref:Acid phosphatase n=1 Tax=Phenylobacterium deserti TaxID=1914756 RepID=A0A328ATX5_9CAUL|nr:phosphatase PAP2 family protein [Phenylobacterium deserti]RAK57725.1 phosphatase PAP2 family protein [Phenylobacterium deserti]
MIRTPLLAALALAALAGCATDSPLATAPVAQAQGPADPAEAAPPPTDLKGYLPAHALEGDEILGPPPAAGSVRERADRAAYEETRKLAGSPRWKQAQEDNDLWFGGAMKRFSCILGKEISPTATPATSRLLQRLELDVRTVGHPAKDRFFRTRPLIGNDAPVCIPRADWLRTNASYPSGHSMTGWAWGLVLAEMAPEKASALVSAGREIGYSRVVCGAHFPSDVEAGRFLSSAMVARLHAEPEFERELALAKAELARARTPAQSCPAA